MTKRCRRRPASYNSCSPGLLDIHHLWWKWATRCLLGVGPTNSFSTAYETAILAWRLLMFGVHATAASVDSPTRGRFKGEYYASTEVHFVGLCDSFCCKRRVRPGWRRNVPRDHGPNS